MEWYPSFFRNSDSQPVVLEHAKYVALSNEEDGVAHFIEDNLLK